MPTREIWLVFLCSHPFSSLIASKRRFREKPKKSRIVHTNQGAQYTGHQFYECSRVHHFIHSESRKGNPYGISMMESFYKTLKREVLPPAPYLTKAQARLELTDYLEAYYNYKRMHFSLNFQTSMEFEHIHDFA
ncbi:TPA: IS3 family transposase [Listeria monocytogenes]|nr:hypothetical protein [Listeria monocytogenes]EAH3957173.1 hypothetical protein [Listeria monocytogenes]EKA2552496.1 DDE-type integrase/transposase/recombinase [Listeria monocytogenes]EKA2555630.1 DDE-type integrase/transposase/recombinase [Listeria monocytogenes]EKA2558774.1 DDE-type integrase/transposase/recombinase [Listeria monocytogenes]